MGGMVVGGESISDLAKAWNIKGWGTAWLYGIYNTDTPRPGFRLFDAFQVNNLRKLVVKRIDLISQLHNNMIQQ